MRIINLSKITSDRGRDFRRDTEELDERGDDAIESTPVSINVEAIRCFYPRRDNRPGTRITFTDGGGFAVTELYDAVAAAVATH